MRKTTKAIIFVAITVLGWLSPSRAEGQTRIRLATLLPSGSSHYQLLEAMGQQWKVASAGAVNVTIYADGTMGSEAREVQRMRNGQLQAATLSVDGLAEIEPSVGALQKIPMLYHSLDEVEYVRAQMTPELERRMEAKGFVVLFWADTGWVHIFSRQPALHPDEFKRTKVFVGADDNDEVEVVKALGFQAVPLAWSDVLTSLQTGLVDTVPDAPFLTLAGQYHSVARHMVALPWVPLVGATVITKKAWDAIPAQQQSAFRTAAVEAGRQMQARGREESLEAIEAMRKRGLQVTPASPELIDEWQHFCEAVYPRMRGTMIPADMFDRVLQLVKRYRQGGDSAKS